MVHGVMPGPLPGAARPNRRSRMNLPPLTNPDHRTRQTCTGLCIASLLGMLAVVAFEPYTAAGFAHGLLYAPLILLAALTGDWRAVVLATGLALVLNALGAYLSPAPLPNAPDIVSLGNRLVGTLAIFTTGLLAVALQWQHARSLHSDRQLRRMADAIPQIVWSANPEGVLTYLNRATLEYTGDPDHSIPLTQNWLNALHPDDRERCMAQWMECVHSGRDYRIEFRILRHDGTYRWHTTSAKPVRDAGGRITHWYGTCIDVEDVKRVENDLRQAQRLESLGQLTGGIAHDFNNLLTVIIGNAELLRDQLADHPALSEQARLVHRAAQRGANLTQRLLAFARRQSLDAAAVDITVLLADSQLLIERTMGDHIATSVTPTPGLWPALIDAGQLEDALLNLALNARDAMPDGGWLTFETRNHTAATARSDSHGTLAAGDYVVVSVSDTGVGITAEDLGRVMEPFFSTKKRGKGTGLGLSMVYGFARQSNGHIEIRSVPGAGTTVELYLPRAAAESTPARREAPSPSLEAAMGRGQSILMVEDDDLVRGFGEGLLRELGYTVVPVARATEALAILERNDDIDLLFTDILMPGGINGHELAQRARRLRPGLRVVFTSGFTDDKGLNPETLRRTGAFLPKPYRRASLAACLDHAMHDHPAAPRDTDT